MKWIMDILLRKVDSRDSFLNASLVSVQKCKEKVVTDGIQIKLLLILIALALWI